MNALRRRSPPILAPSRLSDILGRRSAGVNCVARRTCVSCRSSCAWFKSGARNHLPANRLLEFRFGIRL